MIDLNAEEAALKDSDKPDAEMNSGSASDLFKDVSKKPNPAIPKK